MANESGTGQTESVQRCTEMWCLGPTVSGGHETEVCLEQPATEGESPVGVVSSDDTLGSQSSVRRKSRVNVGGTDFQP